MNCTKCNEKMIILELNQVEIDYCPNCESIWLDAGELELLYEDKNEIPSFSSSVKVNEKKIKCPICNKKMYKVKFESNEDIILDKCKKGDGIWFDANELEKVLLTGSLGKENKIIQQFKEVFQNKFNLSK